MKIRCTSSVLISILALAGCASSPRGPYTSGSEQRDPAKAEASYREAVALLTPTASESDRKTAEEALREALSYDLYHGPAHNNLGVLLLKQDRLYDAAEEFEWARKLLPGNPEPRVNLAIALERGGKFVDAIEAAKTALEVAPGNLEAMQVVAWVQVREGFGDVVPRQYLEQIAQRSTPAWKIWANHRIARNATGPQ